MIHVLKIERENLRGKFSKNFPSILTVDSGDSVVLSTLDAGWGVEAPHDDGTPRKKFEPRDEQDEGHALIGPIAVNNAKAGMTLAVTVYDLRVGPYGWNVAGGWPMPVNDRLGLSQAGEFTLRWSLDADAMIGRNQLGRSVELRPFMGVMGMPPNEAGTHSTTPPRFCGGNIDCKELVVGSTLYLPIPVDGALFSVGDGHAVQGDGEVSGTAIECPMERVKLKFDLIEDLHLTTPRANTPVGWVTFGFHEDLNEATLIALEAMLDLMKELYGMERQEALAMASLVVDLRITQIVNQVCGVHAVLLPRAIR